MNNAYNWYQSLIKPAWAPPSWLFGPVWTILYVIIFFSFGTVFYKAFAGELPWLMVLPFALNLIFNIIFSPLQFGLKNSLLASIDCLLIAVTLVWALMNIWPYANWIVYANLPYLLWVGFATILQLTVTFLNK